MAFDLPPMTLEEAQKLFDKPGISRSVNDKGLDGEIQSRNEAQKARNIALLDNALSLGVKAGLSYQIANINRAVSSLQRDLDLIYDFNPLMINKLVVPAVITEARDLYNQDGDYAVRLSGAFYTIKQQPKFSSVAPNWREYLSFPKVKVDKSSLSMLTPSSEIERDVWRTSVKDGWEQGVEQANIMLTQAMDRLNRDYSGMSRFHRFVVEGKISMPAIATQDIAVTQQGATMAVDETLLRITTLPEFNSKMSAWEGLVLSSRSQARGKPAAEVARTATDTSAGDIAK